MASWIDWITITTLSGATIASISMGSARGHATSCPQMGSLGLNCEWGSSEMSSVAIKSWLCQFTSVQQQKAQRSPAEEYVLETCILFQLKVLEEERNDLTNKHGRQDPSR